MQATWIRNVVVVGMILALAGCDLIKERFSGQSGAAPTPAAASATAEPAPLRPARPAVDETQVLAWVDNEPITIDEFTQHRAAALELARAALQGAPESERLKMEENAKTPETKQALFKQLIEEELLYQDAVARNLEQDAEVRELLRTVKRNALLQKARQRIIDQAQVDAATVTQFYEANKAYFKEPDRARLRVIVVGSEGEAKTLMAQLYGGADFAELARQQSLHDSKERGGEWGPVIREQDRQMQSQQGAAPAGEVVFPALEALIFAEGLKEGSFTAPLQGPDGRWWIAMVTTREPGRQKPLVEVQDAISEYLKSEAYQAALQRYVSDLESQAQSEGRLQLFEQKLEQVQ